jgi:hypothetical protein
MPDAAAVITITLPANRRDEFSVCIFIFISIFIFTR